MSYGRQNNSSSCISNIVSKHVLYEKAEAHFAEANTQNAHLRASTKPTRRQYHDLRNHAAIQKTPDRLFFISAGNEEITSE